jgi:hypothetical protein
MNKIRGAFKSLTMWVNGLFLAAFPFANDIVSGVQDNLPQMAQYVPDNIFKTVGMVVVVFNIYLRVRTKQSLEVKGEKDV